MRFPTLLSLLFCCVLPAANGATLERGAAITDPLALRELETPRAGGLEHSGFGLNRFFASGETISTPIFNDVLFALPSMLPVRRALDAEFDLYVATHTSELPRETIGVVRRLTFNCSTARCCIPAARGSCWLESSIAWTAPTRRKRHAAK